MKSLGRLLKWIGIAAGAAICILLILNAYFVWSTGRRLESRLVALRQAGEPVRLADLARRRSLPRRMRMRFSAARPTTWTRCRRNSSCYIPRKDTRPTR